MKRLFLVLILVLVVTAAAGAFLDHVYRLPILMYHSINYNSNKGDKIIVPPEAFERQMKFLKDRHYNVITLEEAVDYTRRKARPPRKTIAITFDDGYADNYRNAYPILKGYGIPATMFIIVSHVGRDGFMNWDQIKEMSRSGLIDIESHTVNHKWLTGLSKDELYDEMSESRRILEENLGERVKFLCYPMGGYNETVKAAAKDTGYKAAFATKPTKLFENYDLYEIKRVRISRTADNLFVFWIKLSGYHAFFRVLLR